MTINEQEYAETIEMVINKLNHILYNHEHDNSKTISDKAFFKAEVDLALLLLGNIKRLNDTMSKRTKINYCIKNQQIIYLAKKSIAYEDELEDIWDILNSVAYYTISEINELID